MFNISLDVDIRSQYMTKVWPAANKLSVIAANQKARGFLSYEAESCLALNHKQLVLAALKTTEKSLANTLHRCKSVRIPLAVGDNNTMSSAYTREPTKSLPIEQPTPDSASEYNKLSI